MTSACLVCGTPLAGPWALPFRVVGIVRSAKNPTVCSRCNQHIADGTLQEVSVVFIDLSGFSALRDRARITSDISAQ